MAKQLHQLHSSLPSVSQLPPILRSKPALAVLGAISVLGVARTMRALARDYGTWKGLGAGGLPHDVRGYLVNLMLRPFTSKDKTSVDIYAKAQTTSKLESTSFLGTPSGLNPTKLSERSGPRPSVSHHTAPSRQLDMKTSKDLLEKVVDRMRALATQDSAYFTFGESVLERGGPALFLQEKEMERAINHSRGIIKPNEIAHCHMSDGSHHVFLSSKDAEIVLSKGWGERHPLSGRFLLGRGLPAGFVMIYAPRDEKEVDTVLEILKAALRYAAEGRADV